MEAPSSAHPHISHQKQITHQVPGTLIVYNDGSVERHDTLLPACSEFVHGVASKDVVLNPDTGLWVRTFLPQSVLTSHPEKQQQRLAVVLYFHGGGWCICSAASAPMHDFARRMAVKSDSIWVSVNYRLAPEHRLPAAFEDGFEALCWLHSQAVLQSEGEGGGGGEPWLVDHADFSRCYLAGESAGASIVHQVAMRTSEREWDHLVVRGLMILHGGCVKELPKATESTDGFLREEDARTFLDLALPEGGSFGHPLVNPLSEEAPSLRGVRLPPSLIAAADRDLLCEATVEYYEALKAAGQATQLLITPGEGHVFFTRFPDSQETKLFEQRLVQFMSHCLGPGLA